MVAKKSKAVIDTDSHIQLLKYLLVLELWRAGLSQAEIKARLSLDSNVVSGMLRGLIRKGEEP